MSATRYHVALLLHIRRSPNSSMGSISSGFTLCSFRYRTTVRLEIPSFDSSCVCGLRTPFRIRSRICARDILRQCDTVRRFLSPESHRDSLQVTPKTFLINGILHCSLLASLPRVLNSLLPNWTSLVTAGRICQYFPVSKPSILAASVSSNYSEPRFS